MFANRISLLEELVSADPSDRLGHLMLGNEYLSAGRTRDAIPHLAQWCEDAADDIGAACLSLSKAREAEGDLPGARDALRLGVESATRHRHRALLDAFAAETARLAEGASS